MRKRMSRWLVSSLTIALAALVVSGCGGTVSESEPTVRSDESPTEPPIDVTAGLGDALTFHASFDNGVDADWALGDPRLYTAPSYDEQDEAVFGLGNASVDVVEDAGRFGHALHFRERNQHAIFYKADGNVGYASDNWSGTVSFWLRLDPATDLEPGFSDPIQITDAAYNDAAIWVDFTADAPRQFRLGVFGDLEVWNPDGLSPDDHPGFADRLLVVEQPPFAADKWTHVVITYTGLNTPDGTAHLYLDGEPRPLPPTSIDEPFTWNTSRGAIRLGVNYVGFYDEVSLFSRALGDEEVRALYALGSGVTMLHP